MREEYYKLLIRFGRVSALSMIKAQWRNPKLMSRYCVKYLLYHKYVTKKYIN